MGNIERYYQILGLAPGASMDAIKQAYRDMVKIWHPDRFANDPHLQELVEDRLKIINLAYKALTDYHKSRDEHQKRATPFNSSELFNRVQSRYAQAERMRSEPKHRRARSSSAGTFMPSPAYVWFFRISKILAVILSLNLLRLFLNHFRSE